MFKKPKTKELININLCDSTLLFIANMMLKVDTFVESHYNCCIEFFDKALDSEILIDTREKLTIIYNDFKERHKSRLDIWTK